MPHGLPLRARAGIAAGLTLAFLVLAAAPAQADQTRHSEWWLRTLHVTTAWDNTRGPGVTIAVLDTGVDPTQPDLTGSVTTGPDYTNSGRIAGGPFWGIHGTEIASLIAGHGHGAKRADGIIGIAPAAKILSVRVTLESNDPQLANQTIAGALPGAIAHGIRWAVRHDATVIDLPLDPVTTAGAPGSGGNAAEKAAVAYALSKNVVLVAPAGDGGAGTNMVNYPAAYHGVIAVGAFDQRFIKAPFSSRQPYVTVTAAGAGVTVANPSSLLAIAPAKPYTQLNSTSAASAMVTGIVALIRAQFPNLTPAQVTRALTAGTVYRHGGRPAGSGFGTVDATKALTKAAAIAEAVPKAAASGAAQSPPSRPASHSGPIHRNISRELVIDAAIAGVVFLLLLGLIFAVRAWRRRHARSARLAEVRAATQVPSRKPGKAKKGTAKKGQAKKKPAKKGPAKKGTVKKGVPAAPRAPAVVGGQAPDAEAAPELQSAGFIPAPLSPAIPGSASPAFGGSASPTFGGSASTGFTGASGFGGSSSPGFTGSSGFTGSAMPGSAGSASPGFTGSASPGFTGSAMPGFAGSASSGFTGSASSGFAAAPTPPTGPGASPSFGSGAGPGSPDVPPTDAAPPAELAAPVDSASSASQESTTTTRANEPPWAPIPSEPRGLTKDAASAAIPDSAFPAVADAAGTGTAAALGGAGLMGVRRPLTAAHRPAPARTAHVSGRPPWEPAPRPDSELPWAQAPAPPRGGTGSLPKPQQTRPAMPSWDALAEDVWPGGPRGAALHPPVSSPADRNLGGPADRGSTGGAPAMRARPPRRPVPAAGLVPPQADATEQARPAAERPGHLRNPDVGVSPFRAAQPEPAPTADRPGRHGAGSGFSPASRPAHSAASPPDNAAASPPDNAAASPPADPAASPPSGTAADPATGAAASPPDSATASPPSGTAADPATGAAASPPDSARANLSADASPSEPAAPLPWRLSTPPLRPPSPFPPSQPDTGSSLFRSTGQSPFPPPPRPATVPGAAGTWRPSARAGPFPPADKPATGTPASGAPATDAAAANATAAEPGPPDTDKAQPGGPHVLGGPASAPGPAGPGPAFPQARPSAGGSRPTSGVPPWEITDSFLAVPPASAETEQSDPEPKTPGPKTPGPLGGPPDGTAGTGDSTESLPAVDPAAAQRSFPRPDRGDGNENFPAARPRSDEDAFRLFPPVRRTGNEPPAPPATDDQD